MNRPIACVLLLLTTIVAPRFVAADDDPAPPDEPQYEEDTDDDQNIVEDGIDDDDPRLGIKPGQSRPLFSVKNKKYMKAFKYLSKRNHPAGTVSVNASLQYPPGAKCRWKPDNYFVVIHSTKGVVTSKTAPPGTSISLGGPVHGGITVEVGVGTRDGDPTGCNFVLTASGTYRAK